MTLHVRTLAGLAVAFAALPAFAAEPAATESLAPPPVAAPVPPPAPVVEAPVPPAEAPKPAPAAQKPDGVVVLSQAVRLKLGGQFFGAWSYDVAGPNPDPESYDADTEGANRFEVTRAHLNVEPQFGEKVSLRITPDVMRLKDASKGNSAAGSLIFRLKFAYAQVDDVLPGVRVRVGQQPTAWIEFEDAVWKHRVLGPNGHETFGGTLVADTGVSLAGKHDGGLIEWGLSVANGEYFGQPERAEIRAAKYKEGTARVTVAPFLPLENELTRALRLTLLHQYGITQNVGEEHEPALRLRTMAMLTWETKWFSLGAGGGPTLDGRKQKNAAGELVVEDQSGLLLEAFGVAHLPMGFKAIARHDRFDADVDLSPREDPDEDKSTGVRTRTIAGVGYDVNANLYVLADVQRYGYEAVENGKRTDPGTGFFTHVEARF